MLNAFTRHFLAGLLIATAVWAEPGGGAAPAGAAQKHAPLLAGCEPDYPPYCIVTPDNEADGFAVELLRAALKAMGREAAFRTGPWPEMMKDLAEGRLQVLPFVGRTLEREPMFDFTFPYLTMHGAIVVRNDNTSIRAPGDLKGRTVAVLKDDNAEEYLRRSNLGAEIVTRPSFVQALKELSYGQYDAVVIQKLLAVQIIRENGLSNLQIVGPPLTEFTQSFCFAVRKGDAGLLAILNEGLSIVMADGTYRRLYSRWFSDMAAQGERDVRIIIGGQDKQPPYEFLDEKGQPAGFSVDLTRAIARKMNITVQMELGTWSEVREKLAMGRIDGVLSMSYASDRAASAGFSPPYAAIKHVIVVRRGTPMPADLHELGRARILVVKASIMDDLVTGRGLGREIIRVDSQEDALRELASGRGDCALAAMLPAIHWIKAHNWDKLELSPHSVLTTEYCFAFPRGNEDLLAQFTEGLAAVKASGEYKKIRDRWLGAYEGEGFGVVTRNILIGIIILVVFSLLTLLWSISLRRKVAERTQKLTEEVAERQKAEKTLKESQALYQSLVHQMPTGIFRKDAGGRYIFVNPEFCRIKSMRKEDLLGKTPADVEKEELARALAKGGTIPPWQRAIITQGDGHHQLIMQTGRTVGLEEVYHQPDGQKEYFQVLKTPVYDADNRIAGTQGILFDITTRRRLEEQARRDQMEMARLLDQTERSRLELMEALEEQKQTEAALNNSLNEKTTLLKEVHHRVKNNLQVISSLLSMQSAQVKNPIVQEAMQEMQNRIHSMALHHETLYHSESISSINLTRYLGRIVENLVSSYSPMTQGVRHTCHVEDVPLDVEQSIPCGLIVNELVSNAFKYAFPGGRGGHVTVGVRGGEDNKIVLEVADDGVGLPPALDISRASTLGLQLVTILTNRLKGKMEVIRNGGTTFRITFPIAMGRRVAEQAAGRPGTPAPQPKR